MNTGTPSNQKLLEQRRAWAAWEKIRDVLKEEDLKFCGSYAQAARAAPAQIQINGLGQTIAFWNARARDPRYRHYATLAANLSDWLGERIGLDNQSLMLWIMGAGVSAYRRATFEAIAYLIWLKRFAEAEIAVEESDEPTPAPL